VAVVVLVDYTQTVERAATDRLMVHVEEAVVSALAVVAVAAFGMVKEAMVLAVAAKEAKQKIIKFLLQVDQVLEVWVVTVVRVPQPMVEVVIPTERVGTTLPTQTMVSIAKLKHFLQQQAVVVLVLLVVLQITS
jgi:hypothetical protein